MTPKLVRVDGKPDAISVKVTAGKKADAWREGARDLPGRARDRAHEANGTVVIRVNVPKAGVMTISTPHRGCGPKRIGVVGIFLPPLTG